MDFIRAHAQEKKKRFETRMPGPTAAAQIAKQLRKARVLDEEEKRERAVRAAAEKPGQEGGVEQMEMLRTVRLGTRLIYASRLLRFLTRKGQPRPHVALSSRQWTNCLSICLSCRWLFYRWRCSQGPWHLRNRL